MTNSVKKAKFEYKQFKGKEACGKIRIATLERFIGSGLPRAVFHKSNDLPLRVGVLK